MKTMRKIGLTLLIVGVVCLITGLVLSFWVGTIAVPILVSSSVLINSVGIVLLRTRN